jgi:hypothetical protein
VRRIAALATAGVVILVLVLAQLLLPGIAEQQIRDQLARSGNVISVKVDAFPAIELLWHQADRVVIRLGRYRSKPGPLASRLDQATGVDSLDASATEVDTGLLILHDATLRKRGAALSGSARITESDLRTALPFLQSVTPVASSGGQLTLRGTATLLGVSATVDATVGAVNGQLLVQPNVPFGALATVTVFADPHVEVQSLAASSTSDGFRVTAQGRLR